MLITLDSWIRSHAVSMLMYNTVQWLMTPTNYNVYYDGIIKYRYIMVQIEKIDLIGYYLIN